MYLTIRLLEWCVKWGDVWLASSAWPTELQNDFFFFQMSHIKDARVVTALRRWVFWLIHLMIAWWSLSLSDRSKYIAKMLIKPTPTATTARVPRAASYWGRAPDVSSSQHKSGSIYWGSIRLANNVCRHNLSAGIKQHLGHNLIAFCGPSSGKKEWWKQAQHKHQNRSTQVINVVF